jgi:predicted DNA-binding transcriptional regulator AlpA
MPACPNDDPVAAPQHFTIKDLAARLRLSESHTRELVASGRGPRHLRIGGTAGSIRFRVEDVVAWEQALLVSTPSENEQ